MATMDLLYRSVLGSSHEYVPPSVLRYSTLGISTAGYLCLSLLLLLLFLYWYAPDVLLAFINAQIAHFSGMKSQRIRVGSVDYHYLTAGNPSHPCILLVHGFGMDSSMWAVIGSRLVKRGYRILAPDLVGFGQTLPAEADSYSFTAQVERLHAFVHAVLGPEARFHIGGTSMGGAISGIYSASYPADVLSCWLLCPAAILSSHTSDFCEQLKQSRTEGNLLLSHTVSDMRLVFQHLFHNPPFVPEGVFRAWAKEKQARLPIQTAAMQHVTADDQVLLMGERLKDIRAPVCVAWGWYDDILDVSCVDVIRKEVKAGQGVPEPDILLVESGHAITVEQSRVITKHYLRFLRRLEHQGLFPQHAANTACNYAAQPSPDHVKAEPDMPDAGASPSSPSPSPSTSTEADKSDSSKGWDSVNNDKEDDSNSTTKGGSVTVDDSKPSKARQAAEVAAVHVS